MKKFRDEKFLKQFGEHLRLLRKERQLSQEDFASLAETPTSQIGRFEEANEHPPFLPYCFYQGLWKYIRKNYWISRLINFSTAQSEKISHWVRNDFLRKSELANHSL